MLWLGGSPRNAGGRIAGRLAADAGDLQLLAAVQALAAGLAVQDTAFRADAGALPAADPQDALTPRELEVFELMAKGLANQDIAQVLGISRHTAKFHVAQILEKTGSATRTEAVRQGLRMGWIGL